MTKNDSTFNYTERKNLFQIQKTEILTFVTWHHTTLS